MNKRIVFTFLCVGVAGTMLNGQLATKNQAVTTHKQPPTPEDYKKWTLVWGGAISNDGAWYAYNSFNEHSQESTLTIASTKSTKTFSFPCDSYPERQFSPNSNWSACLVPKKGLGLLDLKKGITEYIPLVTKFEFSANDRYLIASTNSSDGTSRLLIMDLATKNQTWIDGLVEYELHLESNQLAYILNLEGQKSVKTLVLGASSKTIGIVENETYHYKNLEWGGEGNVLTFLEELPENLGKQRSYKLYSYHMGKAGAAKLRCLDTTKDTTLFQGLTIKGTPPRQESIHVSEDGTTTVFFTLHKVYDKKIKEDWNKGIEVYNTADKRLAKKEPKEILDYGPWLAAWWPETGKTIVLGTKELPTAKIINDRYVLSYDPLAYAPHFKSKGDLDVYLTDLETGDQSLFLKRGSYPFYVSPRGGFIAYFRDQDWWVYDLKKKTHINTTERLDVAFQGPTNELLGVSENIYQFGGWAEDDSKFVVCDQYDVWAVSPKGFTQRITKGREERIRYRVVNSKKLNSSLGTYVLKLSEGIAMKMLSTITGASGYAVWKPKTGLKTLIYKNMRVSELIKASSSEAYLYKEESFDTPPRYCYWKQGMSNPKTVARTNEHHFDFPWGRSELVKYEDAKGNPLQGALFYPANYKAGEKYPMIVHIYETQSNQLHRYVNPIESSRYGFRTTNYTSEGYFVFLPDIHYQYTNPGISAVDCIEAGVRAVLTKGVVDADHIGLIGHSFGGYQTGFVISQTHLFAAAVAGAGVYDLISKYHSRDGLGNKSNIWRFERQQWRMRDSFYENPEAYFRNSPLMHITNIRTPLLLWTGKEDNTVDMRQSMELFIGLRRLGKDCELLVYPGEHHVINKRQNQLDLTKRIKDWFDGYLKPDQELK